MPEFSFTPHIYCLILEHRGTQGIVAFEVSLELIIT